jgi:hypothetical protein
MENYELQVLQGAGELISGGYIRDIIFENHLGYPSQVTQYLESNGYSIFRIWKGLWKARILQPTQNLFHPWEPPNYLATRDPARAKYLMKNYGYKSLGRK